MKLFLKNLLFTVLVPGTVAVYVPLVITRSRPLTAQYWRLAIGGLLLALGAAIYFWTLWDFASFGRGTPLPVDAPKKLVVRGLYRYTRNPMYLGVILVILGLAAIYADSWLILYAAGVFILTHIFVTQYEEPGLKEQFGQDYDVYRSSVGRWIPITWKHDRPSG